MGRHVDEPLTVRPEAARYEIALRAAAETFGRVSSVTPYNHGAMTEDVWRLRHSEEKLSSHILELRHRDRLAAGHYALLALTRYPVGLEYEAKALCRDLITSCNPILQPRENATYDQINTALRYLVAGYAATGSESLVRRVEQALQELDPGKYDSRVVRGLRVAETLWRKNLTSDHPFTRATVTPEEQIRERVMTAALKPGPVRRVLDLWDRTVARPTRVVEKPKRL